MGTFILTKSLRTISKRDQGIKYFDSHCHLQEPEIMESLDGVMDRWQDIQGGTIVCCGTREDDWQSVMDIAGRYEMVLPSVGLHPWFVHEASSKWEDTLEKYLVDNGNIVCVGEIGLDLLLKNVNPQYQERFFITQMAMAREQKLPVSLHVRKGWDRFIRILKHMGPLPEGGVIHSYSGSADMVELFEKYGLYISFSGSVTNFRNKKVKKALTAVSLDRLLIETDSPAILPVYLDGGGQGWNEPGNIFMVALAVSEILQMDLQYLVELTEKNGQTLFRHFPRHF